MLTTGFILLSKPVSPKSIRTRHKVIKLVHCNYINMRTVPIWIFIWSIALSGNLWGQARFTAPDTLKFLSKTTDFNTLHDHFKLLNQTGDSLDMRWKQYRLNYPSFWSTTFQQPKKWYPSIDGIDSADFWLPDSTDAVNNKLILGVDHNGRPGHGVIIFTVFEKDFPQDSVRLIFDVRVSPGLHTITSLNSSPAIYPNPARNKLYLTLQDHTLPEKIYLIAPDGRTHSLVPEVSGEHIVIRIGAFPPGLYVLTVTGNGILHHQNLQIQ